MAKRNPLIRKIPKMTGKGTGGHKSAGILDDYAVRKVIDAKEVRVDDYVTIGTNIFTVSINGVDTTSKFVSVNDSSATTVAAAFAEHGNTAIKGCVLYGARSRGTGAAQTVVQDGDNLFDIIAIGHDGTDYAQACRIDLEVDGTPGSNDMPGRICFKTSPDGSQTPTEVMRLSSEGGVYLTEIAAADSDIAGKGQLWVKNSTPNQLHFTDDAGNDLPIIQKQYLGDGTDFAVTGPAGFALTRAVAIPYQTSDGAWRLKGNISYTANALSPSTITISGITFKNVANYDQGVTVWGNGVDIVCLATANAATLVTTSGTGTTVQHLSFDVELESKPTWAD
jgi:hypothetical protein